MHIVTPAEVQHKITKIIGCGFLVAVIGIVWIVLAAMVMCVKVLGV